MSPPFRAAGPPVCGEGQVRAARSGVRSARRRCGQTGLYTILLPTIVFALLGSSRLLVVGGGSATAAILASGLAGLTVTGLLPFSATWLAYTSVAALMCEALLLLLARVLKLGFIVDFLSASVLIGFLTGVGIQVLCGSSGRCWQSRPPASC
ncbi:MAG TPA: SulP family inorganic anion transporter [Dermatophilaceae bacterium]